MLVDLALKSARSFVKVHICARACARQVRVGVEFTQALPAA